MRKSFWIVKNPSDEDPTNASSNWNSLPDTEARRHGGTKRGFHKRRPTCPVSDKRDALSHWTTEAIEHRIEVTSRLMFVIRQSKVSANVLP